MTWATVEPAKRGPKPAAPFIRRASGWGSIALSAAAYRALGSPGYVTLGRDAAGRWRILPCISRPFGARSVCPIGPGRMAISCTELWKEMPPGRVYLTPVDGGFEFTL